MAQASTDGIATSDDERIEQLVVDNLGIVTHVLNQLAHRYPRHVARDELWAAGALGLVEAARRYDDRGDVPFAGYAMLRVRGAMIDSTRRRDWASRQTRRLVRESTAAEEQLRSARGHTASDGELAELLGVTVDRLREAREAAVRGTLLHLDVRVGDGEGSTLVDLVPDEDPHTDPEVSLARREVIGAVREAVELLPELERELIERVYLGTDRLDDIARERGVTPARISQVHKQALDALRVGLAASMDGMPDVAPDAPGKRAREAYAQRVAETTSFRTRMVASGTRALVNG